MRLKRNYWLHLRAHDRRRAESWLKSSHRDEAESVVHETFHKLWWYLSAFVIFHFATQIFSARIWICIFVHGGANAGSVVFFTILRQSPWRLPVPVIYTYSSISRTPSALSKELCRLFSLRTAHNRMWKQRQWNVSASLTVYFRFCSERLFVRRRNTEHTHTRFSWANNSFAETKFSLLEIASDDATGR